MRPAHLVLCLGLVAGANAEPRNQRLLEGYAWPPGMSFRIADPEAIVAGPLPALGASQGVADGGPQPAARRSRRASARPAEGPIPRASAAPAAIDPERARLLDMDRSVRHLKGAALDLAKLRAASRNKVGLLPILLFLVERGVITAAEKEALMLDDADTDELFARIADHVSRLASERDLAYVRQYLAEAARPAR